MIITYYVFPLPTRRCSNYCSQMAHQSVQGSTLIMPVKLGRDWRMVKLNVQPWPHLVTKLQKLCHLTSSRWAVLCKLTMFTLNRHDGLTVILTTFEADRLATPYDDNSKTMPFEMVQGL